MDRYCARKKYFDACAELQKLEIAYIVQDVYICILKIVKPPSLDKRSFCSYIVAKCTKIGLFSFEYRFVYVLVSSTSDSN